MRKYMNWVVIISGITAGCSLQAEIIITSPTGLPDESDVVLEKTVDAVKEIPADTVKAAGDTLDFAADELRNTAHGIAAPFRPEVQETVRANMLMDVEQAWSANGRIQMKTFPVKGVLAKELMISAAAGQAKVDARPFFKSIDFPEGCSADYWPEFNRLVVNQTSSGMMAVVEMLAETQQNAEYRQVEIETKFIEVGQKTLKDLGFDWNFSDPWRMSDSWTADLAGQTLSTTLRSAAGAFSGAGPSGTMILTKGGWLPLEMTIRALEQSEGTDVLSAPKLTTQDGTSAQIWVGDREMMPSSFAAGGSDSSSYIDYKGWKEKNIGVHLEVTPTVVEKNLIELELKPEVLDLVGYDTYSITPSNTSMLAWAGKDSLSFSQTISGTAKLPIPNIPDVMDGTYDLMTAILGGGDPNAQDFYSNRLFLGNKGGYQQYGLPLPVVEGSLPVYRLRRIKTSLTIADGSTVGMGGLIYDKLETYKDKVPVLGSIPLIGRLFRSEGERSVKRNLMIFVTAAQVDVAGRRSVDQRTRN